MTNSVLIICGHGLGDCLASFQCANIIKRFNINPKIFLSVRKEIWEPLYYLFKDKYDISHLDEKYSNDNLLLKEESIIKHFSSLCKETYYIIPDLLFNNKYAFDFNKYNTNPEAIMDIRLLPNTNERQKEIYLGLMSTTPGYTYYDNVNLAIKLADSLPEYNIYFPITKKWANIDIPKVELPVYLPKNLEVSYDYPFEYNINKLSHSSYFIGTDNGVSHLAFHMEIPRLLLDPQYGKSAWTVRWREKIEESVPINTPVENVVNVVKNNIIWPQTLCLPRKFCMTQKNWPQELLMKEY